MSRLDDRLTRELERVARPADPTRAFERVDRKRARRAVVRRLQAGGLVVVVLAGTIGGFAILSNTFRGPTAGIGGEPEVHNGSIVYSEVRNAGQRLWVVQPDGTGAHLLTTGEGSSDSGPSISPDGGTVAFTRTDQNGSAIFTIGIDGTGLTLLTNIQGADPVWSPDGSQIAFVGRVGGIYLMNIDGSSAHLVVDRSVVAVHPTWSPDGTRIAFAAPSEAVGSFRNYDIWIADIAGGAPTNITQTPGASELSPSWSPDGSRILFSRSTPSGSMLMTIAPDPAASPTAITDGSVADQNPAWSPDGQFIVFERDAGEADIYTMHADGSNVTVLATLAVSPAWQRVPNGSSLPAPTTSPTHSGPVDIGLAFPVCDVRTMTADLDGNGTADTVYVAMKMSDAPACPSPGTATEVLAVDLNGDGKVDASGGPPACPTGCEPFATPDVNGDGVAEIAIVTDRPADGSKRIQLWEVTTPPGGSLAVLPYVDPNGDPATFSWGSVNNWGGNGPEVFGVSCTIRTSQPLLIEWQAIPNGPGSYHVLEHGYHIVGTELQTAFGDSYDIPGEETVFPDGGGSTFCGVSVAP